jgi:hypothetical protein
MKTFLLFVFAMFVAVNGKIFAIQDSTDNCSEKLMETVSTLTGSNLYQIYLNITIMNDNVDDTDNFEVFDNMLYTLDRQLNTISTQLGKLNKSKFLKKEDYEYIFQLKEIIFQLQEDVKLFKIYLEKSDDDSFKVFFLNHNKCYKSLNDLLGLEDEQNSNE